MRDPKEFQEIESMGGEEEEREPEPRKKSGVTAAPLVQAAVCVLILLAMVVLKYTNGEVYSKVTGWYQSEAAKEIELPSWGERGNGGAASPAPSSAPSEAPPAAQIAEGSLQRV